VPKSGKTSDTSFSAVAKLKIGPVSATFKGAVQFSDIDPPNGYRITGEGEGGIAGFAKGGARVKLTDHEGGTLLSYEVEANVGGKIAQLGARLIDGVAKKWPMNFSIVLPQNLRRLCPSLPRYRQKKFQPQQRPLKGSKVFFEKHLNNSIIRE